MRVFFSQKGEQKKFIDKVLSKTSVKEVAMLCNVSERTIRDWRREKFLMDFDALCKICKENTIKLPSNIKLKDNYWYVEKGARLGWKAVVSKYGKLPKNERKRKRKWYEWWEKEGKHKFHPVRRTIQIKKPSYSEKLAEFVGIMLGDGGITRYQVKITLHSKDDKEYGEFIKDLLKELFDVYIGSCYRKEELVVHYIVSRIELVRFCTERLGLKEGNKIKQQIDIPEWIKKNRLYAIACIRGLVDTDGCIFLHRYKVNGKIYNYKKLSFTSYSSPLRQSVFNILKDNGLNPRFAQRKDVRLDSTKDIKKYFEIFGSHNPKHLKKWEK